ncbi:hypothetical protein Naga_100031g11 [Nannochloropsis gaditana]|uniref:Methyltransferase domain-containing protein n=1 Tax=Nannochloropsis gaditana TaxID=72520 RepID=W7TH87_9STRA|nr:hypothetical protein Naga_100031g11 [Nannochloropsis gaditana]
MLSSCTWASDVGHVQVSCESKKEYMHGRARKTRVRALGRRDAPQYETALRLLLAVAQPAYATSSHALNSLSSSCPIMTNLPYSDTVQNCESTAAWLEGRPGLDPAEGHLCNQERARRKRQQVANLVQACHTYIKYLLATWERNSTGKPIRVIEFCCGSGHVALPLAAMYPPVQFILIDNRPASVHQARARAVRAGLQNVTCRCEDLHQFSLGEEFDLGIALHACGPLTDLVMDLCVQQRAAYVLCPCCIGKVQSSPLEYPRSSRFRALNLDRRHYEALASAADMSVRQFCFSPRIQEERLKDCAFADDEEISRMERQQQHRRRRLCKSFVEMDRGFRAQEAGYSTRLMLLTPRECTPKNDMLCGHPEEWQKLPLDALENIGAEVGHEHVHLVDGDDACAFDAWFGDTVGENVEDLASGDESG